ncbi:hypothetical protein MRS44_013812 [Fusarium solani]|uniref:uncharacterized protein n=1 Tax=Fusarium solani TaxID=169388 RepID=UPI0032C3E1E9|nr:hypothetical protein MRS44_013812 [Fusarium solani]
MASCPKTTSAQMLMESETHISIQHWLDGLLPREDDDFELEPILSAASPQRLGLHRLTMLTTPTTSSSRKRARTQSQRVDASIEATETVEGTSNIMDTGSVEDDDEEEEEDQNTPRSSRQILAYRHPFHSQGVPSLGPGAGNSQSLWRREGSSSELPSLSSPPSPTRSEASTTTGKTNTTNTSRRSKSPAKSVSDLHLAAKPFDYNGEAALPPLLRGLKDARDGIGIIPAGIKANYSQSTDRPQALRELDEIRRILRESKYCQQDSASEAAWNDGVSSRVLYLALEPVPGVRHHNITTARPESSLVPKDMAGDTFDSKLVDYSINLDTHSHETPCQGSRESEKSGILDDMEEAIRRLIALAPITRKTINQTRYGPVRYKPAGVNIETKSATPSDGRLQLSIWIAAWMEQMRYLRALSSSPGSKSPEKLEIFLGPLSCRCP